MTAPPHKDVRVRLDADVYAAAERIAVAKGHRSVASWVRSVLYSVLPPPNCGPEHTCHKTPRSRPAR